MKISTFRTDELDDLMVFLDSNLEENYEKKVFLNIRQRWPEGFLIIKNKGNIVGVCCGAILPNKKLRILILVLKDNYQGKGFGKQLMSLMIKESSIFGVKKVTLEVRKDSKAITFYRKLGFSSVDVLPCYYQDGCDGIVMEKHLQTE
jgi:ribosomal protein S18 acetylase RimI-like enzyme|tara:strand:- start:4033 stop:4473 length:441 start_codon:yes stop_codon:yes gene_type:complete